MKTQILTGPTNCKLRSLLGIHVQHSNKQCKYMLNVPILAHKQFHIIFFCMLGQTNEVFINLFIIQHG